MMKITKVDCLIKILKRVAQSILMGVSLPLVVVLTFEADEVVFNPPLWFWVGAFGIGFSIGFLSSIISDRKGPFDNWNTWSSLAHNKGLSFFIVFFSISPLVVKAAKLTDLEKHLTPIFYAYWFCGLFLLVFVVLFKLFSPKIYGYKNLEAFKVEVNSLIGLREEAREALDSLNVRENDKKIHESERLFLSQDKITLRKMVKDGQVEIDDAYAVLKKRLSYHNSLGRFFVVLFLTVPAYFLPLIFTANVFLVFDQGYNAFSDGSSILKIVSGQ